jgi:hypothetical protein
MKKICSGIVVVIILNIGLSGCYSVKIAAPANSSITLANAYEPLPFSQRFTNWYALFGAVPISKNKTQLAIETMKLNKVRVETRLSFGNMLLNSLLNIILPTTIVTNTIIVEGDIERETIGEKSN